MTTKQYLAALKQLGLTTAGQATAAALGLSLRQCPADCVGPRRRCRRPWRCCWRNISSTGYLSVTFGFRHLAPCLCRLDDFGARLRPALQPHGITCYDPSPKLCGIAAARQRIAKCTGEPGAEYRWAEDHLERLPALADDLVRRQVAAIVVTTTPAVLAAKAATKSISIVFSMGADPVDRQVGGLFALEDAPDVGRLLRLEFPDRLLLILGPVFSYESPSRERIRIKRGTRFY
jgi:hypothetical protein